MKKAVIVIVCSAAVFLAGMFSAAHQLAPFRVVQAVKRSVFPPAAIHNRDQGAFQRRVSLFDALHTRPQIVVVGDSIVQGGEWAELVPGAVNRGIGNDKVDDVAARLDPILAQHPRYVVLMIGINDLGDGARPDETARGLEALLERIRKSGAVPICCSVLHVRNGVPGLSNADIAATNRLVATWCSETGVTFLDLNAKLAPAGYMAARFTNDGVHLLGPAYLVWAEALRGHLDSLVATNGGH